jgi:cellulose synthase/poly-beta-1,6-N-acetylglucosamine synthase-like glycosyltransferase
MPNVGMADALVGVALAPAIASSLERLAVTVMLALALIAAPLLVALYAYGVYPAILWAVDRLKGATTRPAAEMDWPAVTITVPVFNVAGRLRPTIERLLAIDYPRDRLQILVISDASTDGTDDIARSFADRGVELLRLPERRGKTTAENLALASARAEIIVNVDATILVPAGSLKALVRVFADPTIGVASGRDVSVGDVQGEGGGGESSYVGYEMWVRDLETRIGSIVGASGCFYGIRRSVHATPLPGHLSWDFASALVARELGYRSVSVPDAICIVPRTAELRTELRRKVRTMARGLSTLFYKRALMNPLRYGTFALMLISHKLLRWLPYLLAPISLAALALLALGSVEARLLFAVVLLGLLTGLIGMRARGGVGAFRPVALAGFLVAAFTAGFLAWVLALRQTQMATWEPTPRPEAQLS